MNNDLQNDNVHSMASREYDRRRLSYSTTFQNPILKRVIASIEWMTGKITILGWVKKFEEMGVPEKEHYFARVLEIMGIDVKTPMQQVQNIPKTGPVVVVANHPHGMVDGIVLAYLIGRMRNDYRILTRSLLTDLDPIAEQYAIPVPFPHDADAQEKGIQMRKDAMAYLAQGGVVAIFPSGLVASSDTAFGPAIEREWNVFTAKIIQRSGATVVPIRFSGQNSRWYHVANKISAIFRQSLLLHEIANQKNTPQAPTVGPPLSPDECTKWKSDPRGFMQYLRDRTMKLPPNQL